MADSIQGRSRRLLAQQHPFCGSFHRLAVGENIILHTTDGGRSWAEQLEPKRRDGFVSPKEAWVVGPKLLHGGRTWSDHDLPISRGLNTLSCVRFNTPQQGWVGTSDGGVYATKDSGRTWVREAIGGKRYVTALWPSASGLFAATADGDILYGERRQR